MAKITRDDVLKLAQLSRLSLSEEEIESLSGELTEILEYVEQMGKIDVTGLKPTNQVSGNENVMREDEVRDYGYEPRDLLNNVPNGNVEDNHIKVKRMVQ